MTPAADCPLVADYNVQVVASRNTLPQLFALEVAQALPRGAGEGIIRAAYRAGEEPRHAAAELEGYYKLCDCATAWSGAALRKVRIADYATFLDQYRGGGADGAIAAEQTLRTARLVLDQEPFLDAPDQIFLQAARKTLLETQKALHAAARVRDPSAERQTLRAGTAAASRAFVAAWGFLGAAPAQAQATVAAMRSS
jgi:hypothetical protein